MHTPAAVTAFAPHRMEAAAAGTVAPARKAAARPATTSSCGR